jgi:outer membrane protein OmpA-like peptidoglycan-associated protein
MNKTSHPAAPRWRRALITIAAAIVVAVPTFPQTTPPANSPALPGEYSIVDVSPFIGYQWFQVYRHSFRVTKFDSGPVIGFRVSEDPWRYVGLEQSFTVGYNDLRLLPFGFGQYVGTFARNYTLALNPVLHFAPRETKLRPFVTAGLGVTWYVPSKGVNTSTVPGSVPPISDLRTRYGPAVIYGAGIKYNATRYIGLRFELRGLLTQGRYFALPDFPRGPGAIYAPNHGAENALAVMGGIVFRFGHRGNEVSAAPTPVVAAVPPTTPAAPPPTPQPVVDIRIAGVSGARDVCPGEDVRLEVSASGWQPDQTPSYQWMVNGQAVPGADRSSFSVPTTGGSGVKTVTVRVGVLDSSKTSEPVTLRVKDYSAPVVQFTLAESTIPFGTKLPLNATATGSECGGATSLRYSASEGSISGDSFDSGTLAFDPTGRLKKQIKVVHLTATATDQKGGTGSAGADVTVTLSPEARRLDDIDFPAYSARVNNCAKRLLLEQLTPMLRDDPNATVILIGHRDERERGKAAARLDRVRTLNAAAVLSAGTGICPQLELSRVKVNWVGNDQSTPAKPLLCGASTDVKERNGQIVKSSDQRAQFRRVEVWIVPGGAAMPAGVAGLQDAPASDVKKLGCPK